MSFPIPSQSSISTFAPLLPALLGQPAPGPGSTATGASGPSSSGSGVLGALSSKDWFARKAAADLVRAAVMLYGPLLEPDGVWQAGDVRCLSARCIRALDQWCRFDKVRGRQGGKKWAYAAYVARRAGHGRGGGGGAVCEVSERAVYQGAVPVLQVRQGEGLWTWGKRWLMGWGSFKETAGVRQCGRWREMRGV